MVMSEGRSVSTPPTQNGHRVDDVPDPGRAERRPVPETALDVSSEIFGAADEPLRPEPFGRRNDANRRQGDARGRTVGAPGAEAAGRLRAAGENTLAEDLLSSVRSYAESLTIQARADADELLSHAHAQAEQLRARAEAVRAEAERMRAEAAAERIAVRDDADAAGEYAKSAAQTLATAEALRAAMQCEVDAARDEFERIRTEAMAIRRLLRAEADAGVAEMERTRGEIQHLWAETDKLAAVLRQLTARAESTGNLLDTGIESTTQGAEAVRRGIRAEELPHSAAPSQSDDFGVAVPRPAEVARVPRQPVSAPGGEVDVRASWEVVSAETTRENRAERAPAPDPGPTVSGPLPAVEASQPPDDVVQDGGAKRASQPLIGSGGWQQKQALGPPTAPPDAAPLPPASIRRRSRFHRR
jgi:hypothetical protein